MSCLRSPEMGGPGAAVRRVDAVQLSVPRRKLNEDGNHLSRPLGRRSLNGRRTIAAARCRRA